MNAIALPGTVQRRVEAFAIDFLQPSAGPKVDFGAPAGAQALVPADSVSWRVFKSPIALFIGGITAVLLEMGEPRVRDGVWQHSSFRQDALARLQRTGLAAMVTVYGPREVAERMIRGVVGMHGRVTGTTSEGIAYDANDPELLVWVQATAGFGFMEAYHRFVRPLSIEQRDALFVEAQPSAQLYGATGAPASQAELDALFDRMKDKLVPSPIVFEFLSIMDQTAALPVAMRPVQRLLIKAAVDLLPPWVRSRLRLGARWDLRPWERAVVKAVARAGDRIVIRSSPAVQSCRRLGLPDDYLYRR